jgi:hypothetical protein
MRLPVVAGVVAAWLALAAPVYAHVTVSSHPGRSFTTKTAQLVHPKLAVTNPAATTHSGSSQTGSVVLASIAPAAVVALGLVVLRRRTI